MTRLATLPAGQQRAIAVGLLVLLIAAVVAVILVPVVLLHRHYDRAIAELAERQQRYERVATQGPEYRKALDAMKQREVGRFVLKNTAPNLAGAELQELVRAAVEGNGGRITTSQNQPPKDDGRFRQISVTVQFFANTANLQKILFALETQLPYVIVDSLTLRPLNAFRGFKPQPGQEPEVNVQLDASAYALADAGERATSTAPRSPGTAKGT